MVRLTLDRCPDCGHDLRGCPVAGRCPDCGFEYDEHTRVWRSRRSWQRHALVYGLSGLAIGLVLALAYRVIRGHVPRPIFPLLFALAYGAGGLLIRRVLTGRLSGRFVAITPGGIVVGTRRRRRLIPWPEVDRVPKRKGVPKITLRSGDLPVPLEDVFDQPHEFAAFRAQVNQARQRHARRSGAGPPVRED